MLQFPHHILLQDDTHPFGVGKRMDIKGFRCMNYASVAIDVDKLKESDIYDDWLFASQHPWIKDFLKSFEIIE